MTTLLTTPPAAASTARPARAVPVRDSAAPTHGLRPWVVRGSVTLLLLATAALYLIGLGASGYANSFYSAAAQAGSTNWTAWFYGSLDGANSITVDKPPASLWLMSASVKLFGLSSWSILVPEALMGVAAVGVLYLTLRRSLGYGRSGLASTGARAHWAAIFGALTFALTPVATLMFRFNNPDAMLVLLEVIAAYGVIRATERASRKWLVLAGVLVGLGFLTKMLQAFLVLPAFVVAYALAAPATWRKKIVDLLCAFGAMVLSLGWYVAIVELVPTSWRPYIGGSQNNSLLELIFGYNGLGRITGNETGSVGGGQGGGWGQTGITRLFDSVSGGMVTWLVPAALLASVFAFVLLGRRAWANASGRRAALGRTTPAITTAAGLIVFGGWLVVTGLTFSFMAGIYHDYYTVALAPAIGGTIALAVSVLWQHRRKLVARIGLAASMLLTSIWAFVLLGRAGGAWVGLGWAVLVLGTLTAVAFVLVNRIRRRVIVASVLLAGAMSALAGPAAYSVVTAATPHTGSIVTAGPAVSGSGPGGRGGPGGPGQGGPGQGGPGMGRPGANQGSTNQGAPGQPPNGMPGQNGQSNQGQSNQGQTGQGRDGQTGDGGRGNGGMGGLLNGAQVSTAMKTALESNASSFTWVAATIGSQNAASYQLATELPVMAIGGFNGSDDSPTLAQFQQLVAEGKIHYFIAGGGMGGGQQNGGSSAASQITSWVTEHYTATTIGGTTVYDLTGQQS